ncbi:MAG: 1-hydroxycarotenoid 3,4-desaturase CrtD [Bacteroidota bacterium]
MKVGIIGAGVAGLASAIRAACQGHQVSVFEANDHPGGKLVEISLGGYRFDAGPSLFTMPMYVDELFQLAGKDPKAYFSYQRLSTICHYFWEDGTFLQAFDDEEAFRKELKEKLHIDPQIVFDRLENSKYKYETCGKIFLEKSLHRMDTWTNTTVLQHMLKIPEMDIFSSMNQVNEQTLKNPKLVQFFNRFATYNGSNPYKAPGILNMIPHFEHHIGTYFPKGGMHAITQGLYRLACDLGVQFHFGQPVQRIECEGKEAKGLQLADEFFPCDVVISNVDIWFTYKKLLPNLPPPTRRLRLEKSTSALIFYWGIARSFPQLDLHNIFFSEDYKDEFAHLDKGLISDDPTIYVNISQKYEAEDAPEGCENWFTMINVPYNSGQDWDAVIQRARKNILAKLQRMLGVDIEPLIEEEALLDPRSIERRTSSHLGALYGTSSNNTFAAFLRHPNFSKQVRNLYFCGGSVHPGGGIPLCLLSARIISELISKKFSTSKV